MVYSALEQARKTKKNLSSITEMDKLRENIVWYRKKNKWSQEEMAAVFELNRGKIASYETGAAQPGLEMISSICKDLNVYLHEFLAEDMSSYDFEKKHSIASEETLQSLTNVKGYVQNLKALVESLEGEVKKF